MASGFDVAGVVAILVGSLAATAGPFRQARATSDWIVGLPVYRSDLGRGVLLGLELLVAADGKKSRCDSAANRPEAC